MKKILLISGITIAVSILVLGQIRNKKVAQNSNAEQELRELMRDWDEAYLRRDTDALTRILADDFIFTDARGTVSNKAQYIFAIIKSPDMMLIESFDRDEILVRIYGDMAVVTGRSPIKGQPRGRATNGLDRFTDVWVKRQGHWQVVAAQATRVAQHLPSN